LEGIVEHQAAVAILDVTGQIDTQVAQALPIQAVKLLGADVILTGISAALAQTLVQLGLDLSGISSNLQAGVEAALERK
jgi:anti-anti-sigma regulatory factor